MSGWSGWKWKPKNNESLKMGEMFLTTDIRTDVQ